jgi:hypothetical protein
MQPENTEETMRVNGTTMNQEAAVELDESQTTMLEHPLEGIVEDFTGCLEWYSEVQTVGVGTLSQPPPNKYKKHVPRSPHKKPIAALVLPCIPDGVSVESGLIGKFDKLKYSDHDVADTYKYP